MVEVTLSESAWNDLDSITEYIAQDSVRYAQEFGERIFARIEQLKNFPSSGRIVPEFQNEQLRELIMNNYRIVYRIYSSELIVIIRIIHGAKLLN